MIHLAIACNEPSHVESGMLAEHPLVQCKHSSGKALPSVSASRVFTLFNMCKVLLCIFLAKT